MSSKEWVKKMGQENGRRSLMTNAKRAIALGLAGALAVATASPTFARSGRTAAAAGIGFAAGALVGAAAANAAANSYYAPGYAYAPDGYAYASGYTYAPSGAIVYDDPRTGYAYAPMTYDAYRAPVYPMRNCVFDGGYKPDYSNC
jgi:hypothetical protein